MPANVFRLLRNRRSRASGVDTRLFSVRRQCLPREMSSD